LLNGSILTNRVQKRGSISPGSHNGVRTDELAAAAVVDRLLHYSTTVNIRGDSYRLKDKKRAGVFSVPGAKPAL
jgi:DNA replication protein DnaC